MYLGIVFLFEQNLISLAEILIGIFMNEDIREILKHEAEAVLNIPVSDKYDEAIGLIVEQVHKKHGKLVTSGMGRWARLR